MRMQDPLPVIIDHKLKQVERLKSGAIPGVSPGTDERKGRGGRLVRALRGAAGIGVIAEIKRASPSLGRINPGADPRRLALEYESAGACAISVLTEERYFGGSLDDLKTVRSVTELPVLRKDFIVDPIQVDESLMAGADAVLLIVSVLGSEMLERCLSRATELGLDALVEVHDENELEIALNSGARLIGVNSRNLKTLEIHKSIFGRLRPVVPGEITLVAESGIKSREELLEVEMLGYHGALVGTALMLSGDPGAKLREIRGIRPAQGLYAAQEPHTAQGPHAAQRLRLTHRGVKICGITGEQDALAASNLGADAVGFVFADGRRKVNASQVERIKSVLPSSCLAVGVFVDEEVDRVIRTTVICGLDAVQLHGAETPDYCLALRDGLANAGLSSVAIIKAFSVGTGRSGKDLLSSVAAYADCVDAFLLDGAASPSNSGQGSGVPRGGTGSKFDWNLAGRVKAAFPHITLILAGGLDPENVREAIRLSGADWVDVSSGVQATGSPRRKDPVKIAEFIQSARAVDGNPNRDGNPVRNPDPNGYFGEYGGRYVPETLIPALEELEREYLRYSSDPAFRAELGSVLRDYSGRPTPLYRAERLEEYLKRSRSGFGRTRIYLKREDLNHTGAHKINNALGQVLLALRMGKRRIIAETGAGQHGVATATVCAKYGLECVVYMGEEDMRRQELNVYRMKLLGAEVRPVKSGSRTLKDACNEAIRDWVTNVETTHYIIGSAVGPHPYPMMVRDFQRVIGDEVREQCRKAEGRDPDILLACVGGGSNAIGLFYPFIDDSGVRLIGVEAGGKGTSSGLHAASLTCGSEGILHGSKSFVLQDPHGQILEAYSISAGLDYPGVGPEHSWLMRSGRADYVVVDDETALRGFHLLCSTEGIIPALESAHAIGYLISGDFAGDAVDGKIVVLNLSGRGDKDVDIVSRQERAQAAGDLHLRG